MTQPAPAPAAGFAPLNPAPGPVPVPPVQVTTGPYATGTSGAGAPGAGQLSPEIFVNEFTRLLPDPATVFSGPGYYSPRTPACGFSTAALLLSLLGVVLVVPALLAIACGHIGIHRTRNFRRTGRGLALGGMMLGYAVTLFWAVLISTTWIADL